MAHLATIASHHVNGVAALHSELVQSELFPDFAALWPHKFTNVTNWYIPNRWIDYLLGSGLALLSGLLLFPNSALSRYRQLLEQRDPAAQESLERLYPAAREEAAWLGQSLPAPD